MVTKQFAVSSHCGIEKWTNDVGQAKSYLYELFKHMIMAGRILMGIGLSKRDTTNGREEYQETNCRNRFETCT